MNKNLVFLIIGCVLILSGYLVLLLPPLTTLLNDIPTYYLHVEVSFGLMMSGIIALVFGAQQYS